MPYATVKTVLISPAVADSAQGRVEHLLEQKHFVHPLTVHFG